MTLGAASGPRLARALVVAVPMVAVSAYSHAVAGGLAAGPVVAPLAVAGIAVSVSALRSWSSVVWWALVVGASELVFHAAFLAPGSHAASAVHEEPETAHAIAGLAVLVLLGHVVRRFRTVIARRIGRVRTLSSVSPVEVPAPHPPRGSLSRPVPLALVTSVTRRGPPLRAFA